MDQHVVRVAHLANAVARGEIGFVFVNPSAMLTQAYRGKGLFKEPLPLRAVFTYPSWDRFVVVMHPRTGLKSLAEVKEKKYPLRLSIREDETHSTRVLHGSTAGGLRLHAEGSAGVGRQPADEMAAPATSGVRPRCVREA